MTDWQPIETAPKEITRDEFGNNELLIFSPKLGVVVAYWQMGHGNIETGWCAPTRYQEFCVLGPYESPTHWMPLPEPPK